MHVFILLLGLIALAGATNPDGRSVEMTRNSLHAIDADQPWFIKFYAPWCGHCQRLEPVWKDLAQTLKDNVGVGEVNCETNRALCMEYNVSGLPSLKFMAHGSAFEYSGDRSFDHLLGYVQNMTRPPLRKVTYDSLQQLTSESEVSLVHVYGEDPASLDVLEQVAPQFMDRIPFLATNDPEAIAQIGLGTVIVKDGRYVAYTDTEWSTAHLTAWVHKERFPLVSKVGRDNSARLLRGDRLVVLGIFKDDSGREQFRNIAEHWRDHSKVLALFADLDGMAYNNFVYRTYGVTQALMPVILIVDPMNNLYFDRDAEAKPLRMDEPKIILKALEDAAAGTLTGVSTLPAAKNQSVQTFLRLLQEHWTAVFVGFSAIVAILIWLLNSTREDTGPTTSPAPPATAASKKQD
ncbi:hypothetical protein DFQ28_007134 [Apophysomyces sp. BC1034]|nr:hypothetical protein DFQ30_007061 [Apophysomyces sp. BC1015]KAG0176580.1 hypothetical protein DFQ29_005946 [Apophysomyces sp. BC1021]KAG0186922.1 hypothetical protein DFQ28_007134 [Apophysomyces sp. BC1034]